MTLRIGSLLLLLACAASVPGVHGAERVGDAIHSYELDRYANAAAALESVFVSSIENASGADRFYLYWTYNHLTGSWVQVEYLQIQLELLFEVQSYADEQSIRILLRDQAEFVRWELGHAIEDLEQSMTEVRPLNHLWINEALRRLLSEVRTTVDRLWHDQCVYVPCISGT